MLFYLYTETKFTMKILIEGNKAEIIIGKQRNGPIGKTYLTFLKQYARFEDFVPDDRLPEEGLYSKFE